MKVLDFLVTKLNRFSVVGSLVYGLFCASFPTPEVVAVIGYIAYFLSAALFYFAMYVFYSMYKESILKLRHNFFKKIVLGLLMFYLIVLVVSMVYMFVYHVSYGEAVDMLATHISTFFYYIPFLP